MSDTTSESRSPSAGGSATDSAASAADVAELQTTTELVELAQRRLSDHAWGFIMGGAETETTMRRNRHALDSLAFRPRVLRDVSGADPVTSFLGRDERLPVLLAPIASTSDIHPEGILPAARAAARFGCPLMLSSVAGADLVEVARAAGAELLFQLYADGDTAWVLELAARAVEAGARAICVTVDVPTFGRRERVLMGRQSIGGRPFNQLRAGESHRGEADWTLIERLRESINVPLMVKGIQTSEDARLALGHGVDIVYVSNHGGRQLDHCRGAIDSLPEVAQAVRGHAEVIVDGGFVRGTDILKAISLGASFVGIGRLQALALGAAGEDGVVRLLELLELELRVAMKLLGVTRCAELDGGFLQPVPALSEPSPLGAFPLLG